MHDIHVFRELYAYHISRLGGYNKHQILSRDLPFNVGILELSCKICKLGVGSQNIKKNCSHACCERCIKDMATF